MGMGMVKLWTQIWAQLPADWKLEFGYWDLWNAGVWSNRDLGSMWYCGWRLGLCGRVIQGCLLVGIL